MGPGGERVFVSGDLRNGLVGAAAELARAAGRGCVRFALAKPGRYRSAIRGGRPSGDERPPGGGDPRARSYQLLTECLDRLAPCGRTPACRRPFAETAAWAPLHGLASLMVDGPLAGLSDRLRDEAIEHALDAVVAGLTSG